MVRDHPVRHALSAITSNVRAVVIHRAMHAGNHVFQDCSHEIVFPGALLLTALARQPR